MKQSIDHYFDTAKSWADDIYIETLASRSRYRFAFILSMGIISLLVLALMILLPLQHTQFMVVHHSDDGAVWMELLNHELPQPKQSQVESDIVRYVVNRESYSADFYDHQYALVNLLSDASVAQQYQHWQNAASSNSPINRFKHHTVRRVHVQNILFIKHDSKHPLAQVNFTVSDYDRYTGHVKTHPMLALISWKYRGMAKDPSSRWMNWDGFAVTQYSRQQQRVN